MSPVCGEPAQNPRQKLQLTALICDISLEASASEGLPSTTLTAIKSTNVSRLVLQIADDPNTGAAEVVGRLAPPSR